MYHGGKWDNILASFMECDAPDKGINSPRNPPRRGICLTSTQTSRIYIILLLVLIINNTLHFSNLHFYFLLSRCRSLKSLLSLLLLLSVPSLPLAVTNHHHHLLGQHQSFSRYFMVVRTFLGSSNSGFRFPAMVMPTRTAALQVRLMELPALALSARLSTAMALSSAATTMKV
jgi:hypothetical protein